MPKKGLLHPPSRCMFPVKRASNRSRPSELAFCGADEPLRGLADEAVTDARWDLMLNQLPELGIMNESDIVAVPKKLGCMPLLPAVITVLPYGAGAAH